EGGARPARAHFLSSNSLIDFCTQLLLKTMVLGSCDDFSLFGCPWPVVFGSSQSSGLPSIQEITPKVARESFQPSGSPYCCSSIPTILSRASALPGLSSQLLSLGKASQTRATA